MYTGSFRAQSNRAEWRFAVTLTDRDTGDATDLTGATIELALRDQQSAQSALEASTTDGGIVVDDPTAGTFTVTVPKETMADLAPNHYDVGMRVTLASGRNFQLIRAVLPVIDGVIDS